MNFEFNKENIITVFFNSDEREHITVIYRDENDKDCVYNLRVRSADKDFQYLLTLYSMEEIEQKTIDHVKALWEAQQQMQKELIEAGEVSIQSADYDKEAYRQNVLEETLKIGAMSESELKEQDDGPTLLFEAKLQLFDLDEVISAPVQVKEKIRSSKSFAELYHHIYEHRCSVSSLPADDTDQE